MKLGRYALHTPVILAPMAGVTGVAFRQLCRESAASVMPPGDSCPGLYVCEMISDRALVQHNEKTLRMLRFAPEERPRSMQLLGSDPQVIAAAVQIVAEHDLADHIDLNFGCPVPKVTRRGEGAALPWKIDRYRRVVEAAVARATPAGIPVTVKMRTGLDPEHLTYQLAGQVAQDAGVAAVTLHGRTLIQGYAGEVDLAAIADLKQRLSIPVFGNGNIWEAEDALRMMAETGVDGVAIGRGCLGRPWLFADLAAAFAGASERAAPNLGGVCRIMLRHLTLLVAAMGEEPHACADFRKHVPWYLKGFPVGGDLRRHLAMVTSIARLEGLLSQLDQDTPFPQRHTGEPRGRTSTAHRLALPEAWLA